MTHFYQDDRTLRLSLHFGIFILIAQRLGREFHIEKILYVKKNLYVKKILIQCLFNIHVKMMFLAIINPKKQEREKK